MTDADTLRLLDDAAQGFARFDAKRVRGWRDTPPCFDREQWQAMAEQGWFGIVVDEEAGGLGLGLDAAATVAQALGKAAMPEPFVAAGLVAPLVLARCPDSDRKQDALSLVISGETVAALAWQGPTGGLDASDTHVQAVADGQSHTLTGSVRFVVPAHADAFIVLAGGPDGRALYWVPADSAGLEVVAEAQADGGASGLLHFNGVCVAQDDRLAGADHAGAIVAEATDYGIVANCAELNGVIARALELTLEYLKTRKQFGQPIGAFQVLQHRSVDLWLQAEVARHVTTACARKAGSEGIGAAARAIAASGAKSRVGDAARLFANETVQLHGAIGFTDEYDLGLYVNRMLALAPYLGNAAEHRRRYGQLKQNAGVAE